VLLVKATDWSLYRERFTSDDQFGEKGSAAVLGRNQSNVLKKYF